MKILIVLSLLFSFVSSNLYAQSQDSLQTLLIPQSDSVKASDSTVSSASNPNKKLKKNSPQKTSSKDSGIIIGSLVGAAAGVGIAALLGSFSLEPSNSKKASLGELILGGVVGAVIGGIVGGLVSK